VWARPLTGDTGLPIIAVLSSFLRTAFETGAFFTRDCIHCVPCTKINSETKLPLLWRQWLQTMQLHKLLTVYDVYDVVYSTSVASWW